MHICGTCCKVSSVENLHDDADVQRVRAEAAREGAKAERERIVAWLRTLAALVPLPGWVSLRVAKAVASSFADAIEAGAHDREGRG